MYKTHEFNFKPMLVATQRRYTIDLPPEASPIVYKTITTNMRSWHGELTKFYPEYAAALIKDANVGLVEIQGVLVSRIQLGHPCYVMEHLCIDGTMDYLISSTSVGPNVNINFVNYGTPMGKHLRIDFYTGIFEVIE